MNESILKPVLQALESHVPLYQREQRRRLESLAPHQIEIIAILILCEDDIEELFHGQGSEVEGSGDEASKDLKQRVPTILDIEVDPKGGQRVQEATMKLFRGH
uniref:Uncharacterized protein n=1 Tax=Nelumbo nucifera TaxID=4432 RepID=A0A822Y590_NELNU|nr:TPA_asm: hypothetical protein HUJ06_026242 [Nelumbo nucifera]